ncbi:T-cell ecto-ADP-ribosyltransferase 1-like [Scomber japonicus]|uniref:T-cell ecto-ADP-ribosyltransferase 1-like n=1 Tax=Scomber japonicus TaxID=13676 RepID=UPI0023058019|nr:T-cell ecto-ADP-ribosyltransferase 1-like [Scomber japonicus]
MKVYQLILAPAFLLLCWKQPAVHSQDPRPLDMVPEAIDDDYGGCKDKMEAKITSTYLAKELKGLFNVAWKQVNECAKKEPEPEDKALTETHMRAICTYTNIIYSEFNKEVRTGKNIYTTTFRFHTLHYWLTTAIQILSSTQGCQTSYRRTKSKYGAEAGDVIRFGMFASSSKDKDLTSFGSETCFEIETCSGADLKHYPYRGTDEGEVLIPPYETFKITRVIEKKGEYEPLPDCEKVFILKSERNYVSNLRCQAAN